MRTIPPSKEEISKRIDEVCTEAGSDLAIACKRVLGNLTDDEVERFTQGQYPYRLAKTLLCSVSDRIEQQWAAEATLGEIKALKRIRKSRYC